VTRRTHRIYTRAHTYTCTQKKTKSTRENVELICQTRDSY